jgi:hypothetical protein
MVKLSSNNQSLLFVYLHILTVLSLFLKPSQQCSSRRAFFQSACVAVGPPAALTFFFSHAALAVPPLTDDADEGRIHKIMMASTLPPPGDKNNKIHQRQKLSLNSALLLTRSSYAETDQLDIVPVNQLARTRHVSDESDEEETYIVGLLA